MKKALALSAIIAMTLNFQSAKAEEHEEAETGAISGLVIGALAGGPVGALGGAIIGAFGGDYIAQEDELEESKEKVMQLDQSNIELASTIDELQLELEQQDLMLTDTRNLVAEAIELNIMFKTNQTTLDENHEMLIVRLADLMQRYPSMNLQLDGFADPRGTKEENEKLSFERVESVKTALIKAGINPKRIEANAYGEQKSNATKGDLDA